MGTPYGDGTTDYEKYIRTGGLYALMRGPDGLVNDDELLFQVTHMAMELWLAVVIQHAETAGHHMHAGRASDAAATLNRAAGIVEMLTGSLRHIEQMKPWSYHAIRVTLGQGSGQQSPTFNALLKAVPALNAPYAAALKHAKVTVDEIQQAPEKHPAMYSLTAAMLLLDENFMRWRYAHYQLVQRIIGNKVMSLVGVPAAALEKHALTPAFPDLWDCISRTTEAYNAARGGAPGLSGAYTLPPKK
jgi:tryptophan 2,3-dioxygenase